MSDEPTFRWRRLYLGLLLVRVGNGTPPTSLLFQTRDYKQRARERRK